MGLGGISHWIIILVIVLLLFGAGRISGVMGELGKGLKSFKQGMSDEEEEARRREKERSSLPHNHDRPIDVTPEPRRTADSVPGNDRADR
jgi:sec-independent protein translocase protein TatA